jgi:signal transduction histidine kinase
MRERLRLVDGELMIQTRAGEGTTIDARVSLTKSARQAAAAESVGVA